MSNFAVSFLFFNVFFSKNYSNFSEEMPRTTANFQLLFPSFTLPSVKSYIIFSAVLFFSGFYYYYNIVRTLMSNSDAELIIENIGEETLIEADDDDTNLLKNIAILLRKHRLLLYVLLNTCCAFVAFIGQTLNVFFFGELSNQEESFLRKYFRRYFQAKLTFLIFISHHNLLEDILIWIPWLGIQIVCLLMLELAALRMANTYNVISSRAIWRRLFAATSIIGISSLLMIFFIFGIKDYVNLNHSIFLATDCCIIFLQAAYLICKLFALHDMNVQNQHRQRAYYLDLTYGLLRDCLEFANYLHIIFYSQLAITYCCVFLMIQAQHYYGRISTKIKKHMQQREIINHINSSYQEASEEDLLKTEECLICWQTLKSARKLPCSHIFHEHCLRRWLEQDSSCAVCRKSLSLNLNNVRPQPAVVRDELNQTMQTLLDLFSPHNRWWSRFFFEPMNGEQVNGIVTQVSEMFPQISVDVIRQIVNNTGSLTATIETLLEGNAALNNPNVADDPMQQGQAAIVNNESSSDESYNSTEEEESEGQAAIHQDEIPPQKALIPPSQSNLLIRTKNEWLNNQMHSMLLTNRKKYILSAKGQDICKLYQVSAD